MPGGTTTPWEVILEWPPRSNNPVRRGWSLTIFTVLAYAFTISVLAARLWARHVIQRNAGIDDLVILVAVIPVTALAICITGGGRWWYFDRHVWDLTAEQGVFSRKMAMAIELLYLYSTSLVKISILLFYRRMVRGSYSPSFLWAVRGCIAFVICYAAAFTFTLFLGCRPLPAFWHKVDIAWVMTHEEGKDWRCFNEAANLLAATAFSVLQDFITCLMPTIIFWKLSLPVRQKIALSIIFGMGIFTCVAGIVRLYYIYQIFYVTYDTTWIAYPTWFWTSVEIHLGIVCASLPALKIFFQNHVKPTQLRVYLDSWRGEDALQSGTGNNKTMRVTSKFLGRRVRNEAQSTSEPLSNKEHDVEGLGIQFTKEVELEKEYTHDRKHTCFDTIESAPISPLSQTLIRHSTNGSRRPLRLHDPSEDQRPGSYAASGLLNDKRRLGIHNFEDRRQSLASMDSSGRQRPRSLPGSNIMTEQERTPRSEDVVEKRSSIG